MGIYSLKQAFRERLTAVAALCVGRGISADALTLGGLAASLAGGAALAVSGHRQALLLAVPVLALGPVTLNALDGMVAAEAGTARPFGAVLNELADQLSDAAFFAGLAFRHAGLALGSLVLALLASSVGVATKPAGGPRLSLGMVGKADRTVLLAVVAPAGILAGPAVLAAFACPRPARAGCARCRCSVAKLERLAQRQLPRAPSAARGRSKSFRHRRRGDQIGVSPSPISLS